MGVHLLLGGHVVGREWRDDRTGRVLHLVRHERDRGGRSFKLFDAPSVSGDFSRESWTVSGLEEFSLKASLGVRDGGVWLDVANGGTCVIFR